MPLPNTTDKMTSSEFPSTIPYEDDKFKWDYDDKGVVCRQDKETDGWEVMEPHCAECGHRNNECVCNDDEEVCDGCGKEAELGDVEGKALCEACVDDLNENTVYPDEHEEEDVFQEWKDWYDALPEAGKKIVKERLTEQLAERADKVDCGCCGGCA